MRSDPVKLRSLYTESGRQMTRDEWGDPTVIDVVVVGKELTGKILRPVVADVRRRCVI